VLGCKQARKNPARKGYQGDMKANKGRRSRGNRKDKNRGSDEWGMGCVPKGIKQKKKREKLRVSDYLVPEEPDDLDEA